ERSEAGYRQAYVEGLGNLLNVIQADRLLFVSSTAVYGQEAGEWVDERSPTEPSAFNGRILLEAEALARSAGGSAVRFSGIYGPGRERMLDLARSGPVSCRRTPPVWTNRIHADDCAAVLEHLLHLDRIESVYAASDQCPAPRWEVLQWLAERLDAPAPVDDPDAGGGQGKRVFPARLLASGLALQYPDYTRGYAAMLSDQ
ncbi:MAG: SDR family NAD(P)-dependent oxidoreductase, partial [Wenzhouxiangellaceae bacterium]